MPANTTFVTRIAAALAAAAMTVSLFVTSFAVPQTAAITTVLA